MQEVDKTFSECDANGDGLLDRYEFVNFVVAMYQFYADCGLKHRETTDELIDRVYPSFNGFNPATDAGVSKEEILTIMDLL